MASACNNLAEFYRLRRRYDEAEPLYKQVGRCAVLLQRGWSIAAGCGVQRCLLPDSHPTHTHIHTHTDHHHHRIQQPAEPHPTTCPAMPPSTPPPQALQILTKAYGLHDARVAFALHNLGGFHLARRQLEQAAECYEQALRLKLEVLGTGHRCGGPSVYQGWVG